MRHRIALRFWDAVYDVCVFIARQFDGMAEYADYRQAMVPRSRSEHLWEDDK